MRREAFVIAVVCFGAGCDGVFGLTEVHADGDGVNADACVRIGHDEDSDGLDDGCDPCPFGANDIDDDGDGIPLACDPDPTTKNTRLMFTGFGGVGPQIELRAATLSNDAVTTNIDPLKQNSYVLWPDVGSDNVWVVMGVDVGATLSSATYRQIGFIFDGIDTGAADLDGTYCILGERTTSSPMNYVQVYTRLAPAVDDALMEGVSSLPLANWHGVVRASYSRAQSPQLSCEFRSTTGPVAVITGTRPPPAPGRLGVFIDDTETAIRFVFVVGKS